MATTSGRNKKRKKKSLRLSRPPPSRPPKFVVLFQKKEKHDHAGGYTVKFDVPMPGDIVIETPFNASPEHVIK